jgi:hypothetical protein
VVLRGGFMVVMVLVVVFGVDARGGWCWFLVVTLVVASADFW